jgi:hypothetical protein
VFFSEYIFTDRKDNECLKGQEARVLEVFLWFAFVNVGESHTSNF